MVTILILALLIIIGIKIMGNRNDNVAGAGAVLVLLVSLFLTGHLFVFLPKSYFYGKWIAERDSFEMTLKEVRQNGSEIERAAITKEVSEWNRKLASAKYRNSHWFFGQYVDDRVETLEPIK